MAKNTIKNEKKYEVLIPKIYASKGEDAMYLCVNDEAIRIKYGVKVLIPERFKAVLDEHIRANEYADAYVEEVAFKPASDK